MNEFITRLNRTSRFFFAGQGYKDFFSEVDSKSLNPDLLPSMMYVYYINALPEQQNPETYRFQVLRLKYIEFK